MSSDSSSAPLSSLKFNFKDKHSLKANLNLAVHVTDYEDTEYSNGNIITHYIIQVKFDIPAFCSTSSSNSLQNLLNESYAKDSNSITKTAYKLSKRYSEFKLLYEALQDCIKLVAPDYRFPNKSLFSNSKEFTKTRRLKGFHDLLNILSDIRPFPRELEAFIDLDSILNSSGTERVRTIEYLNSLGEVLYSSVSPHGGGGGGGRDFDDRASGLYVVSAQQGRGSGSVSIDPTTRRNSNSHSRNYANDATVADSRSTEGNNGHSNAAAIAAINDDGAVRSSNLAKSGDTVTSATRSISTSQSVHRSSSSFLNFTFLELEEVVSEEIPPLLPASIKIALILYCSTIWLNVIDTRHSSATEVFVTFLLLCLLITLVRLHLKKSYSQ